MLCMNLISKRKSNINSHDFHRWRQTVKDKLTSVRFLGNGYCRWIFFYVPLCFLFLQFFFSFPLFFSLLSLTIFFLFSFFVPKKLSFLPSPLPPLLYPFFLLFFFFYCYLSIIIIIIFHVTFFFLVISYCEDIGHYSHTV